MTADADLTKRQINWLPYWLEKGHWTVPEAAALLVGFLPPEPDEARPLGPWLPGREPWEHAREAWEFTVQQDLYNVRQWLATIANLGLIAPKKLLGSAIKAGVVPPWMPALLESEHAKLLPASLRAKPEEGVKANGSYGARYKERPTWADAVIEAERLFKANVPNKRIADGLATKGLGTFSQSAVDGWVRQFRKKNTAEEMTAEFRLWKERNGKA
jgi:hypothetical protein